MEAGAIGTIHPMSVPKIHRTIHRTDLASGTLYKTSIPYTDYIDYNLIILVAVK